MNKDILRRAVSQPTFIPFTVYTADGCTYPVPERDFVSLSPQGRTLTVYTARDEVFLIDVALIIAIKDSVDPKPTTDEHK